MTNHNSQERNRQREISRLKRIYTELIDKLKMSEGVVEVGLACMGNLIESGDPDDEIQECREKLQQCVIIENYHRNAFQLAVTRLLRLGYVFTEEELSNNEFWLLA